MNTYQIMSWYDIPVQVRAGGRRDRVSVMLPSRFQEAVDDAAMAARLTGTDGYLNGFKWGEPIAREGTPQEVVAQVAAELEAQYPTIDWRKTADALRQEQLTSE